MTVTVRARDAGRVEKLGLTICLSEIHLAAPVAWPKQRDQRHEAVRPRSADR